MNGSISLLLAAQNGDSEAMERIVLENSGLIWAIARRYFGRGVEADDLYQLGCVGLIKAVQGFDESYGTQFSTYAVPKIAGEIRRFLRDDGPVKISRSVKERASFIRGAQEKLLYTLGREPRLSEIAEECCLSAEEVAEAEISMEPTQSFQKTAGEEGMPLESLLGDDGLEDGLLDKLSLREAVDTLAEKERSVILLRYYKGMTQEAAARVLGVSQVQVSRLERRALQLLRKQLT